MKIAVCLSGQPRTIEYVIPSLLDFFSGDHEFDFFCHTWNYNTYKHKKENPIPEEHPVYWSTDETVDVVTLEKILERLNPKKAVIHSIAALGKRRFSWDSLFYSMMYANHLKKSYEIENNFRYDFVVKSRYDICFLPSTKFKLPIGQSKDNYLDVYTSHAARMSFEYDRINTSDTVFYGSSLAMDLLSDSYRVVSKKLHTPSRRYDDFECLGPGTRLSDFMESKNMRIISCLGDNCEAVYRPEMIPANPLVEFDRINQYNQSFYK